MAHPVVVWYFSYSTTFSELCIHHLWRCPAFGRAGTCLFLSLCEMINQSPEKKWPHDHGPTNVRAMVKKHFKVVLCTLKSTFNSEHFVFTFQQTLPFVSCWRIPGQWVSKWSWIIGHSHLFEETDLKLDGVALLITDPSQRNSPKSKLNKQIA